MLSVCSAPKNWKRNHRHPGGSPVIQATSSPCKSCHLQKHTGSRESRQSSTAGYLSTMGLTAGWIIYGEEAGVQRERQHLYVKNRRHKVSLLTQGNEWESTNFELHKIGALCKGTWHQTIISTTWGTHVKSRRRSLTFINYPGFHSAPVSLRVLNDMVLSFFKSFKDLGTLNWDTMLYTHNFSKMVYLLFIL